MIYRNIRNGKSISLSGAPVTEKVNKNKIDIINYDHYNGVVVQNCIKYKRPFRTALLNEIEVRRK